MGQFRQAFTIIYLLFIPSTILSSDLQELARKKLKFKLIGCVGYLCIFFFQGLLVFFSAAMALALKRLNLVFQDDDCGVEGANYQN
jgi:hypothetical protein